MALIVVLLIVAGVCITSATLIWLLNKHHWDIDELWPFVLIGALTLILGLSLLAHWSIRSHKVEVFNEFMGTNFTQTQYYWAGATIYDLYTDYDLGTMERKDITVEGVGFLED